jgi:hypothetical protein
MASSMSVIATAARSICASVRVWITSTFSCKVRSSSLWHCWQALLTLASGLCTLWLLTFIAPPALVGHVAIRTAHAAAGVDALAPKLELGVLHLVDLMAPVSPCL